jgi:hypothetical protein
MGLCWKETCSGGIYDPPRKPKLVAADSGLLVADVVSGLLVLEN